MSLLTDTQKSQLDYVFKKDAANIIKTDNNSAPLSLSGEKNKNLTSVIVPGSNVWAQSDILGQGITGAVNAGVAVKQTLVQLKSIHGGATGTYALTNDGLSALYGVAWQAVDNSNNRITNWVSPSYNEDYALTFYHGTTSGSAQSFVSTIDNPFVFDYKTGIFTFLNGTAYENLTKDVQPGTSEFIYMTGYTYTGTTLSNFSSTYKYSQSNIGLTGVTGNNYMTVSNNSTVVDIYSYGTYPSSSDTLLFEPSFDVTSSNSVINFSASFSSLPLLSNGTNRWPNPSGLLNAYIFIGIQNTISGKYYGFILNDPDLSQFRYFIGNGITQYPTSSPTWTRGFHQSSLFSITFTNSTIIYYIDNNIVYVDKNKDILANFGSYKININDTIVPTGSYGISNYGIRAAFSYINLYSLKDGNIALGYNAGYTGQQPLSIAIGTNAGYTGQNFNSVAIGNGAGSAGQGAYAVAIGNNAGYSGQPPFSIALNATPNALNPGTTGFFVKPVRGDTGTTGYLPVYNPTSCELFSNPTLSWNGSDTLTVGGTGNLSVTGTGTFFKGIIPRIISSTDWNNVSIPKKSQITRTLPSEGVYSILVYDPNRSTVNSVIYLQASISAIVICTSGGPTFGGCLQAILNGSNYTDWYVQIFTTQTWNNYNGTLSTNYSFGYRNYTDNDLTMNINAARLL